MNETSTVMLLTRISFNQIQICWLYHPRFVVGSATIYYTGLFSENPISLSAQKRARLNSPSLPRNETKLGRLWSVHHWGAARGYYGFAYYRQLCHNTGATKGSKVECQSLEANALPKKLRWNLISFDLVKILRLTSSAPFSHFKSENHFCSLQNFETAWCVHFSHLEIWCPNVHPGGHGW